MMTNIKHIIIGCGDVGRRIASQLIDSGESGETVLGLVQSLESVVLCTELGIQIEQVDLDQGDESFKELHQANCYYLVPPQKSGLEDLRSRALLTRLKMNGIVPNKIVLISTTGVYGDCDGAWVTEQTIAKPQTDRGKRRLDSEQQWSLWANEQCLRLTILRVPGIYANSRLPRTRIKQRTPVVKSEECGFTNRIHADDLAAIAITAMHNDQHQGIYNATDGTPGKISEYLQAAAQVLNLPKLPEISIQQAQNELSSGMLSYLSESRRISNEKILKELNIKLRYPNFKEGLKFG